jgi:hypothetical protein
MKKVSRVLAALALIGLTATAFAGQKTTTFRTGDGVPRPVWMPANADSGQIVTYYLLKRHYIPPSTVPDRIDTLKTWERITIWY